MLRLRALRQMLMAGASSTPPVKPVVAIVGATGTGKSQLAVDIATRFNGEIINADAMQMYQGLPIITNKITAQERKGIPHHLLGCVGLDEPTWKVDRFVKEATALIDDMHHRDKLPVIVGGTHYYLQSLLFKKRLVEDVDTEHATKSIHPDLDLPTEQIYEKLKEVDPVIAERWHPSDRRKIRRSLEIWYQTGKRASDIYREQTSERQALAVSGEATLTYPTLFLWTETPRQILYDRLDRRVDKMLIDGLLGEVRQLHDLKLEKKSAKIEVDMTRGIWVSIGFKEFLHYVEATLAETHEDEVDHPNLLNEAVEATKAATRHYAKSQIKWISIKLLIALREAGASDHIFLLDTSDPSEENWQKSIQAQACDTTEAFLRGQPLPKRESFSKLASEMLRPARAYDLGQRPDLWQRQTCSICQVTAVTESQWQEHMRSNRHRKRSHKIALRTRLEARGIYARKTF